MTTLHYMDKGISDDAIVRLARIYRSMFFPRDGLGDFYIIDSDREMMKEKNVYLSKLLKELDDLLK